jgi:hypothetical protein
MIVVRGAFSLTFGPTVLALTVLAWALGASPSRAQMHGSGGHRGGSPDSATQAAPPPPAAIPDPWPRLEPGAVLCRTLEDLVRYQARLVRDQASDPSGPPPDCRRIQDRIQITILEHQGPARTKVALSGSTAETGWTDSYLPPTPPASAATTARIR